MRSYYAAKVTSELPNSTAKVPLHSAHDERPPITRTKMSCGFRTEIIIFAGETELKSQVSFPPPGANSFRVRKPKVSLGLRNSSNLCSPPAALRVPRISHNRGRL